MSEAASIEGKLNTEYPTAQRWVDEFERCVDERESIMAEAMSRCRAVRLRERDIKKAAKADGISPLIFNATIECRKNDKKRLKIFSDLEIHDYGENLVDELNNLLSSLKPLIGLPLADAAIAAAEWRVAASGKKSTRQRRSELLDDLTDGGVTVVTLDTTAADAVRAGIKQLDP